VRPRNLLDIVANDFDTEALTAKVSKPLKGLKVVSYYGCLLIGRRSTPGGGTIRSTRRRWTGWWG